MYFRYFFILIYFFNLFNYDYILSQKDWSSWGIDPILSPREIFYPSNIEEIIDIIRSAYDNNFKVRAIGSCHSWSNLINTDGYVINTDNLNKILHIDHETKRVKVECGIKLNDLFQSLAHENLALPNQGFIDRQSIVGAISTGTHGTGHTGPLSDFIVEFEVIDCFGVLHKVSQSTNCQWLPILRVGLGALGFIYSVTLQCQDLFVLNDKRITSTLDQAIKNYKEYYANNDYYMFMAHIDSDTALNFFWNRTQEKVKRKVISDFANRVLSNKMLSMNVGLPIIKYNSSAGKKLMQLWLMGMQNECNQYSYLSLSPLKDPISVNYYIEAEYAIDINNFTQAISQFIEFYKEYQKHYHSLTALITCRFAPESNSSYLSMSYQRETAYITVNIINYFDDYIDFFKKLEHLLENYQARPHWGKFHLLTKDKVSHLFKEGFEKFNYLRSKLDPCKIFSNQFIERCFG